ncbi:hypothetical protein D3C85_1341430 [compost metagenome]
MIQRVEKRPNPQVGLQLYAQRSGLVITLGVADALELRGNPQCRQLPLHCRCLGATDAGTVAGNVDPRHIEFAPGIGDRAETQLIQVPLMPGAQGLAELDIRHHALVQQHTTGVDALRLAGGAEGQRPGRLLALHRQVFGTGVMSDPGTAQAAHQFQSLAQIRPGAQRGKQVAAGTPVIFGPRGVDQGLDCHAGPQILPAEQIQQWATTGQEHRLARRQS